MALNSFLLGCGMSISAEADDITIIQNEIPRNSMQGHLGLQDLTTYHVEGKANAFSQRVEALGEGTS